MKIEHVAVYVEDLERTKEFFIKYFNATSNEMYHNKNTDFKSYFLSFNSGARLEIMNKPNIKKINDSLIYGFTHLAFSVGSKDGVDTLTEKLKKDGYEIQSGPRTTGDGYYESLVAIVENILIEITI